MIKLGDRVRDNISGFSGIATGRCEYLYAGLSVMVTPEEMRDGKPVEPQWFDERRLSLVTT